MIDNFWSYLEWWVWSRGAIVAAFIINSSWLGNHTAGEWLCLSLTVATPLIGDVFIAGALLALIWLLLGGQGVY